MNRNLAESRLKYLVHTISAILLFICISPGISKTVNCGSADSALSGVLSENQQTNPYLQTSNLPIVIIDTNGQSIPNQNRITAYMSVIDNEYARNDISGPITGYNGYIGIELRGSSSLQFPKQPYRVETIDSLGNNLDVKLLGMPRENDWIFHNPYSDKTMLRNVLLYQLASDMGWYAPRARFCEVILNNDYQGVYVVLEKIKRDKNRLNISSLDSSDVADDNLTGGYIIKIDKVEGESTGGWTSANKIHYEYHYPAADELLPVQKEYIQNFMTSFENAASGSDWDDPVIGYASYINMDSFVDYFILSELSRNVDSYRLSAFMYKDRDSRGGKLTMGPIWDYNLAFGNADYYECWMTEGWDLVFLLNYMQGDPYKVPFWWGVVMNDPQFMQRVSTRWQVLRQGILNSDRLSSMINTLSDSLGEAQIRNYKRWNSLGNYVWPNFFIGDTYEEEVEYMKGWLLERCRWIDSQIIFSQTLKVDNSTPVMANTLNLAQNYPNPFNMQTSFSFSLEKRADTRLEIFNLLGQKVKTLINGYMPAGEHLLNWNGSNEYGVLLPSGIYTYRLQCGNRTVTKKLVLIE